MLFIQQAEQAFELHTRAAFVQIRIYDLLDSLLKSQKEVRDLNNQSTGLTLDYRLFQKVKLLKSKFSAKH